jgi:HYR domain-containing protein
MSFRTSSRSLVSALVVLCSGSLAKPAFAASLGSGRVTSVTPVDGGCVHQSSLPTSAVEKWDVEEGKTYQVVLDHVTDVANGGTDATIQVLVKSSSNGNQCLTATKQSTGVYSFAVTMPAHACFTYPIQYGVANCSASTSASRLARRSDGGDSESHLRAAHFGPGCTNPTPDESCDPGGGVTLDCPDGVEVCADSGRCDAVVPFEVSATSDYPPVTVVCTPASGSTFSHGTTSVHCTATDAEQNSAECSFDVTVDDCEPPALRCPESITAECTSPSGAAVSFTATATDACDSSVAIVCSPASGSTFGFGTTQVCCTATDDAQNAARCCFDVTVVDTTPPSIQCPAPITAECTSPSGAAVTFAAGATDLCDANPALTCTPASGSTFGFGSTRVCCTATDDSNNRSRCFFQVTVVDRTPPEIHCPSDVTTECAGPSGTVVTFTVPATDVCDASPTVACTPPSGSTFTSGTTQVCCTATDDHENSARCCFDVTVSDCVTPGIQCPDPITTECASASGAIVTYTVSGTGGDVAIQCDPPSGSLFPIGTTQVCCTATYGTKDSDRCCFDVTVVDSTPPAIHCPPDRTIECTGPQGAIAAFTVTATDACDPNPTIVCTPASGSNFAFGVTRVCCSATDAHQRSSRCYFRITVVDTTPPTLSYPHGLTVPCTGELTTVTYICTAADLCDPNPTVDCVPPSGSGFPRGASTVACTATDDSGNVEHGDFQVTVDGSTSAHSKTTVVGQPASALVFPLFDSTRGRGTILTVTNTDTSTRVCSNRRREGDVCVHYVYFGFEPEIGGCAEFDVTECLTPGDTLTVFADQQNPEGTLGWLWVEARDPETGRAIDFDHLIGSAIVVDMGADFLFHYQPYGFRSYADEEEGAERDACGHAFTDVDHDGCADFDGTEYDYWPQLLLLDEFFQEGNGTSSCFANELTLASCDLDPFDRQRTRVSVLTWNNRERHFSAALDFECFFRGPLSSITNVARRLQGDPNELVFGGHHLQTGWIQLSANEPILGVFHQRVINSFFAAGHELHFAGEFGGPCDDDPTHEPCCLRRD